MKTLTFLICVLFITACIEIPTNNPSQPAVQSTPKISPDVNNNDIDLNDLITEVDLISVNPDSNFNVLTNASDYRLYSEYSNNAVQFDTINVAHAWSRGATGANISIAIIDTGIRNYSEFVNRNPELASPFYHNGETLVYDFNNDISQGEHATVVSHFAAASFYGIHKNPDNLNISNSKLNNLKKYGTTGISFEANIIDIPLLYYQSQPQYEPTANDSLLANALREATKKASYVNMSFGVPETPYDTTKSELAYLYKIYRDDIFDAFAQNDKPMSEKSIFVIAAGNLGDDQPSLEYSSYGNLDPALKDLTIVVGGIDSSTNNSIFNKCGYTYDHCVVAPANDLQSTTNFILDGLAIYAFSNYYQGTSFSAPLVTGALALIDDYFNGTLSPYEVSQRLLNTANNDNCELLVCGQGIIDLDAATKPQGNLTLELGLQINDFKAKTSPFNIHTANQIVSVDASQVMDNVNIMMVDSLDSPFYIPAGKLIDISSVISPTDPLAAGRMTAIHSAPQSATHFQAKKMSYTGTDLFLQSSLFEVNAGKLDYKNFCGKACLSESTFHHALNIDFIQASFASEKYSFVAGSCLKTHSACFNLGSNIKLGWNISAHANFAQLDESLASSNQNIDWFGIDITGSSKQLQSNHWGRNYSQLSTLGFNLKTDPQSDWFYQLTDINSLWEHNDIHAWIKGGEIALTQHHLGYQHQTAYRYLKAQINTYEYEHTNNIAIVLPTSRTVNKDVVYSDYSLPLNLAINHEFSLLLGLKKHNNFFSRSFSIQWALRDSLQSESLSEAQTIALMMNVEW